MDQHVGALQNFQRAQGHVVRIARAEADAIEVAGFGAAHSSALARALTAAAAIAEPPRRPCTTTNGRSRCRASACFELDSPDEADGNPDHGGWSRSALAHHFQQTEQGRGGISEHNDRTRKPLTPEFHGGGAARIVKLAGERRNARIVQGADHIVRGRQARSGDPIRHHSGIAKDGSTGPKRLCGKVRKTRRHLHVTRQVGHAAGVDHAHDEAFLGAGEARQISLRADHREGAPVDLGTFPHVFVCGGHGRCVPKTRMKSALLEQGASRWTIKSMPARPTGLWRAVPSSTT